MVPGKENQPQSSQGAQSVDIFLCVLCALCGLSKKKIIKSLNIIQGNFSPPHKLNMLIK